MLNYLTELQATLLMTLLRNSHGVVKFKLNLTKEFYRMRRALMERQTTEWQQTKIIGKWESINETDALAQLC
jgi:phage regulator Rha-like protein